MRRSNLKWAVNWPQTSYPGTGSGVSTQAEEPLAAVIGRRCDKLPVWIGTRSAVVGRGVGATASTTLDPSLDRPLDRMGPATDLDRLHPVALSSDGDRKPRNPAVWHPQRG